jgi:hypothetical protein
MKLSRKQMVSLGWGKPKSKKKEEKHLVVDSEQLKEVLRDSWSEETFQHEVIALAHSYGWRVAHFRRVRVQRRNGSIYYETPVQADGEGFPDLVLHKGNVQCVVELKVGSNTLTLEQSEWLESFRRVGAKVGCFYPHDWDFIVTLLQGAA